MKRLGWVYVADNHAIPGWVKIGFTRKNPSKRAKSLSTAGVPGAWQIRHASYTGEVIEAELQIHRTLKAAGIVFDRELFQTSVAIAGPILDQVVRDIDCQFPLESSDFLDIADFT